MLKGGIRKNNMTYYLCGKNLLGQLFFTGNHPMYRKLYTYMDYDMACMPEYMWNTVSNTIGVKVQGRGGVDDDDTAENYDFCVEDINKKLKNSMSWAPSKMTWLIACRTYNLCVSLSKKACKWMQRCDIPSCQSRARSDLFSLHMHADYNMKNTEMV